MHTDSHLTFSHRMARAYCQWFAAYNIRHTMYDVLCTTYYVRHSYLPGTFLKNTTYTDACIVFLIEIIRRYRVIGERNIHEPEVRWQPFYPPGIVTGNTHYRLYCLVNSLNTFIVNIIHTSVLLYSYRVD